MAIKQGYGGERLCPLTHNGIKPNLRTDLKIHGAELAGLLILTCRAMNASEFITAQFGYDDCVHRKVVGKRTRHHLLSDPPTPTELHGAHVDFVHLGRANVAIRLFDQDAWHASPSELNCKAQPNRTAANDQYGSLNQISFLSLDSQSRPMQGRFVGDDSRGCQSVSQQLAFCNFICCRFQRKSCCRHCNVCTSFR